MGMTAILHTWGQNLSQHVHLHCLIPAGALSEDHKHWHAAKSNYLFPVKALSRHFRGAMIRQAYQIDELHRLEAEAFKQRLSQLMQKDWVIYSKAYLKKSETIVRYVGHYIHKIALSDQRIKAITENQISFDYKDYRDNKNKSMPLAPAEFIRRFLLHVLPEGFIRIRHYGFLSNRTRQQSLRTIRACLNAPMPLIKNEDEPMIERHKSTAYRPIQKVNTPVSVQNVTPVICAYTRISRLNR